MLLKNTGSKIINIGSVIMMPDSEQEFKKEDLDTPAIKLLCEMGLLSITETAADKKPAKAKKAAPVEEVIDIAIEDVEPEDPAVSEEPEKPAAKKATKKKTQKTAE